MPNDKHSAEYQQAWNLIMKYFLKYGIKHESHDNNEIYSIGNNFIVASVGPTGIYDGNINGKPLPKLMSPQWLFHFMKEQNRIQNQKIFQTVVILQTVSNNKFAKTA